jgi:REP element-mobilizing transposase RayT
MTLYKNKYRSETHRLVGRDYSQEGVYFITICCEGKNCFLGTIQENAMILNDWGKIVEDEILLSIEKRTDWAFHQWVIMPNHLHFLIEIVRTNKVDTHNVDTHNVDTHCSAYLQQQQQQPTLHRKPRSISSFVAIFKSKTTKKIREMIENPEQKIWQNNYHDHIVRNQEGFNKIYHYIGNNPVMWQKDKFYNSPIL